jgi:hypothetical protein
MSEKGYSRTWSVRANSYRHFMDVPALEPHLAALMIRLVELDAGRYRTFVPVFRGGMGGAEFLDVELRDGETFDEGAIHELEAHGLVSIEPTGKRLGKFRITPLGRETAGDARTAAGAAYQRRLDRGDDDNVDLDWPAVESIAAGIYRLYKTNGGDRGLNGSAVRDELAPAMRDAPFSRVLRELRDQEWITYVAEAGRSIPVGVRAAPKMTSHFGRWPSGGGDNDLVLVRLLSALEDATADAPPEKKETARRIRDFILDLGSKTTAEIVTRASGVG